MKKLLRDAAEECGFVDPKKVEDILGVSGPESVEQLTQQQIISLAATIPAPTMTAIAIGYMDISDATIKNLQYESKDDTYTFTREVLKHWMKYNPKNQHQVSLLFTRYI